MTGTIFCGAARWVAASDVDHRFGLFRWDDGAGAWDTVGGGLPADAEVRCIVPSPHDAQTIYAGTQLGPYVSRDGGARWESMGLPGDNTVVWSILPHPTDPRILYTGTQDLGVFRTDDGGASWRTLPVVEPAGLCRMGFPSRVIRLVLDPSNPDEVYAGIEVGGVVRSLDGGETWEDLSPELLKLAEQPHLKSRIGSDTDTEGMMDTHSLAISPTHPGTVFLATRMGIFRSDDRGVHWQELDISRFSDLTYARDVQVSPHDPETLFAALSVAAVSDAGSIYRSQDFGETWSRFDRGTSVESTMMHIGLSLDSPDRVYGAARRGQVFASEDGGASWQTLPLPSGVEGVYAIAAA